MLAMMVGVLWVGPGIFHIGAIVYLPSSSANSSLYDKEGEIFTKPRQELG